MSKYAKLFSLRKTPQSQPIAGTVANAAGGYAFPVDDWTRLDRFLILGTEGGSYYAGERALTVAPMSPRYASAASAMSDPAQPNIVSGKR